MPNQSNSFSIEKRLNLFSTISPNLHMTPCFVSDVQGFILSSFTCITINNLKVNFFLFSIFEQLSEQKVNRLLLDIDERFVKLD